jgi:hypothetical protein
MKIFVDSWRYFCKTLKIDWGGVYGRINYYKTVISFKGQIKGWLVAFSSENQNNSLEFLKRAARQRRKGKVYGTDKIC